MYIYCNLPAIQTINGFIFHLSHFCILPSEYQISLLKILSSYQVWNTSFCFSPDYVHALILSTEMCPSLLGWFLSSLQCASSLFSSHWSIFLELCWPQVPLNWTFSGILSELIFPAYCLVVQLTQTTIMRERESLYCANIDLDWPMGKPEVYFLLDSLYEKVSFYGWYSPELVVLMFQRGGWSSQG